MAEVDVERPSAGVAVIALNAPARRNSLTVDLAEELVEVCEQIDADSSVGAVVVRGRGPSFCAGADRAVLADVAASPASSAGYRSLTTIYEAFSRVGRLASPTISAVQGTAVGAGLNLALSTDLALVSDDARFVAGFMPLGAHPGGGHFALASRRAGPQTAAALSLFGQQFVGVECVQAGLAHEALPEPQLVQRAVELAAVPGADPELARRSVESFRMQAYAWSDQPRAARLEHAAQMWSLARSAGFHGD